MELPPSALSKLTQRWAPGPDLAQDPMTWVSQNLPEVHLWSKQREILSALVTEPHVAVQSCHSAGKSFMSALTTCWWIASHPPGEAFVVTTAPTGDQVKIILWRELHRMHAAAGLGGKLNLTEWVLNGETVALGRKPNEYEPTAFQGIHARYVLVILDEACGIPKTLWDAASTLTSNQHGRILAVGNPDDPNSHFARVCELSSWHTVRISAFDTPNFTGEEVPELLKDMLVSQRWVADKAEEWGETSALYQSKVLGLFPRDAEDGVVPASWAAQCRRLDLQPGDGILHGGVQVGLDVGAGGDRSVARVRDGRRALQSYSANTPDPEQVAQLGFKAVIESQATVIKVDSNGIGWGVCGLLRNMFRAANVPCRVVPVNTSKKSSDQDKFHNLRAELWWLAREACRTQEWDLSNEFVSDATIAELVEPKYRITPAGKILVEPKPEVKKRLGRSPDDADALMLAFYWPKRKRTQQYAHGADTVAAMGPVPEHVLT